MHKPLLEGTVTVKCPYCGCITVNCLTAPQVEKEKTKQPSDDLMLRGIERQHEADLSGGSQ